MKRKVVWVVVSGLMVLSLLMASCAPAAPEEEVVAPPEEEVVVTEEEVAPALEGPLYGGVIKQMSTKDVGGFDPGYEPLGLHLKLCNEELLTGDWAKGPAGTGELSWAGSGFRLQDEVGCLAESWERPEPGTIIFHIRQGVHWHDKPPVNGRELTADDVAFSFNYLLGSLWSFLRDHHNTEDVTLVEAIDKWTVRVKCNPQTEPSMFMDLADGAQIIPPEVIEQYGDMNDWENVCGTGPFILVDYVSDSSVKFVRNPNYWRKDPVNPENTLPYVDGVDILVVPDTTVARAALRVGKIDRCGLSWEEAPIMWETNPELVWKKQAGGKAMLISMRVDRPELPFQDIRVRRALAMGIDQQEIADKYFEGKADIFGWPIKNTPDFSDMYVPLEEFPEEIRELFEYHPDKSRQLLAEAGYPNGIKIEMQVGSGDVDAMSIVKEYWADIGVDLELAVTESSLMKSITKSKAYDMCYAKTVLHEPCLLRDARVGSIANRSCVDDPLVEELNLRVNEVFLEPEARRITKEEYIPYLLKSCWQISFPVAAGYTFWQPWLKGYYGEDSVGRANNGNWPIYAWIDLELKKQMTGR